LQDTLALSTTEVEYMTDVETFKEALCLRELVSMFGIIHESAQV